VPGNPNIPKGRAARTTTILDLKAPFGTTPGQRSAAPTSKPLTASGAVRVNEADVQDPGRLVRIINDLQAKNDRMTQASRTNPHNAPCIVRRVAMTNGSTVIIPHSLGRPYTGWWMCRPHRWADANRTTSSGLPFYANEIEPTDTDYPYGNSASDVLILVPGVTGVYDIAITGD